MQPSRVLGMAFYLLCSLWALMQSLVFSYQSSHSCLCWEALPAIHFSLACCKPRKVQSLEVLKPRMFRRFTSSIFCPIVAKSVPLQSLTSVLTPEKRVPEKSKVYTSTTLSRGSATPWSKMIFSLAQRCSHRSLPAPALLKSIPLSPSPSAEKPGCLGWPPCPWAPRSAHLHHSPARNGNHTS